jgi:hypothetical protein
LAGAAPSTPASPLAAQPSSLLHPATQVFVASSQCSLGAQVSFDFVHCTHLPLAVSHARAPDVTHSTCDLHALGPASLLPASLTVEVSTLASVVGAGGVVVEAELQPISSAIRAEPKRSIRPY